MTATGEVLALTSPRPHCLKRKEDTDTVGSLKYMFLLFHLKSSFYFFVRHPWGCFFVSPVGDADLAAVIFGLLPLLLLLTLLRAAAKKRRERRGIEEVRCLNLWKVNLEIGSIDEQSLFPDFFSTWPAPVARQRDELTSDEEDSMER